MVVGSGGARSHWKKVMRVALLLFHPSFNSSKCKTTAKMAVARIKLLRNKRDAVIKQMRRDIAMLLESRQDSVARIRVEHVIREQNIMAANELIELFCDLVVARLSIIGKQRECPADLKEGVSSLLFAAPRCSEIPELLSIRDVFQKKYGKDFVSAATDLRPNAAVNRLLIEKLSVKTPSGETKLNVLKGIAKEYQVQWDTTESEMELLQAPEERIGGTANFVSAASLPLKPVAKQSPEANELTGSKEINIACFQDLASAAQKALAAAEAAANLARGTNIATHRNEETNCADFGAYRRNFTGKIMQNNFGDQLVPSARVHDIAGGEDDARKIMRRQSCNDQKRSNINFDESDCDDDADKMEDAASNDEKRRIHRRHSYNARSTIKFDESDCEDGSEMGYPMSGHKQPPNRQAPQVPFQRVHPKLPDYDALTARFEALKQPKSRT